MIYSMNCCYFRN